MEPYIDIHTHYTGREAPEAILNVYSWRMGHEPVPPKIFSAGIHPWDAVMDDNVLRRLLDMLITCPACAIGETGLDFSPVHKTHAQRQQEIFEAQLDVAEKRHLPVVLHCVKSLPEVISTVKRFRVPAVILHGYTGNSQQAAEALRHGYCLSFGLRSLASPKSIEVLRTLPADRLFLETDASGADICDIYAQTAAIRHTTTEELTRTIYNNFKNVFTHYDRMA